MLLYTTILLLFVLSLHSSLIKSESIESYDDGQICYGVNLTRTGIVGDSQVFLPKMCNFLYSDSKKSDKKYSCCLKSNQQKFEKRIDDIKNQMYSPLVECDGRVIPNTGFSYVGPNGETPDLTMGNEKILNVLDTRFYIQTCMEHLMELQCILCSTDQLQILGRPNTEQIPRSWAKTDDVTNFTQPIFYYDFDRSNKQGKPLVLCDNYFEQLNDICGYLNVRNTSFKLAYLLHKFGGMMSSGGGLPVDEVVREIHSPDGNDFLLTSDRNCYTRKLPEYTPPTCVFIVENVWRSPYTKASGDPSFGDAKSSLHNNILFNSPILLIFYIVLILVYHLYYK